MTVLTESEEKTIINWIIESAKKGFPKRREDVIASVKNFLDDCPRDHPFGKHNMPGKGWYNLFLKRHPCITTRIPEAVTAASSKISPENLFKWFNQIENYLTDKNLLSILSDPSRLFNGDETNFLLCPKTKNVLAKVGTKNVYEVEQAPSKSCLTVMFSFSAAGNMVPPMIIYPYKRIPDGIRNSVPPHWGVGRSDSGWMTKEVFFEYISNIFYPYLTKNNIKFPVVLFVDGHVTHLTYELSVLCKKLEIILIALYPNATRILQPCDVSAFKPLKSAWQKVVLNWKRDNMHSTLKRENFAPLLQKAIDQAVNPVTIQNGFKACGIYPFNKLAIDFSKCLGKSIHGNKHDTVQGQSNELDENRNTINLQQFSDIVGTKLVELQSVEDRDLILKTEEFQCLHKIYKSLLMASDIIKPMDIMDINDFIYLPDEFSVEPIEAIEERELECRDTPETQVEEESVNCVAVSQLIEPIIVEPNKATGKTIDQYMRWVTTPERKNNKSYKENLPFVITSSGYSKIQEQKRKEKVEKEVQKEQRQLLRIENREKKLKLKQEKCIIKKKPQKKSNPKLQTNKHPVKKLTFDQFIPLEHLAHTSLTALDNSVTVSIEASHIRLPNQSSHHEEKLPPITPDNSCITECSKQDGIKENDIVLLNKSGEIIDKDKTTSENDEILSGKMCYNCTRSIHKNNKGLSCGKCRAEYHIHCANKLNLSVEPVFLCTYCKD